jgi:hypothetical protein
MFAKLFKGLSIAKDISTVATFDSKKIVKRGKNKIKAKLLNKALAKVGFWRI